MPSYAFRTLAALIVSIFFLVYTSQGLAQSADGSSVGVLSASSALMAPMGVRALGMGGAITARPDDLSALRYNPAGLSLMGYWEWALSSHELPKHVQANSLALSAPLPYGNLGFYGQWLTVRDNAQVRHGEHSHPDRNKYSYHTGLAYAAPLKGRYIHVGGGLKFFGADFPPSAERDDSQIFYPRSRRGIFLDLGILATYDLSDLKGFFFYLPRVSAGFAVRNLHPRFGMRNEVQRDYHPEYVSGISLYYRYRFMLNGDISLSPHLPAMFRWGMEYWPFYFLALRLGMSRQGAIKGAYWGLGLGESVGSSKVSLEYAGQVYFENAAYRATANMENLAAISGLRETYHSFAIHQSFENIKRYTDYYGKTRVVPVAITDRYVSAYRFAREIQPEEIIDDIWEATNIPQSDDYDPNAIRPKDDRPLPEVPEKEEGKKAVAKRFRIAVFPFAEYYTTSEPFPNTFSTNLRASILEFALKQEALLLVSEWRVKNSPRREAGENDIQYLNRLCKFHSADLLLLPALEIDHRETHLKARLVYFRANDKEISALSEYWNTYERFEVLRENVVKDFALQTSSLLDTNLGDR